MAKRRSKYKIASEKANKLSALFDAKKGTKNPMSLDEYSKRWRLITDKYGVIV